MLPSPKTADIDSTLSPGVASIWPETLIPQVEDLRLRNFEINCTSNKPGPESLIQLPSLWSFHRVNLRWIRYQGPVLHWRHLGLHASYIDISGVENTLVTLH